MAKAKTRMGDLKNKGVFANERLPVVNVITVIIIGIDLGSKISRWIIDPIRIECNDITLRRSIDEKKHVSLGDCRKRKGKMIRM